MNLRTTLPWLLLGSLALTACEKRVPEPTREPLPSASPIDSAPIASGSGGPAAKPASDLQIEDLKVGTGNAIKSGDTAVVHYTGTLLDGTKFDSSVDRNQPFDFKLGAGGVIKGWDEGVAGMKKGGKRRLTIPPAKAYGAHGSPPKIPANATLKFEIELLDIK